MSAGRLVLGIDTAQRFGSIALAGNGNAAAWESLAPGEHSSGLSRAAERILSGRGLELQDLAGIAVSGGPGSFTGLRIGLAWAKGVCLGLSLELTLVSEHEVNAYRHRQSPGLIATVLPGERGEAQAALWSGGTGVSCLWGPERVHEKELVATLREAAGASKVTVAAPELPSPLLESLRGAGFLTGLNETVVVDIGGTTTLAGILVKGFPRQSSSAVEVGGVRTNFRMPDLVSMGNGGGSVVRKVDGRVTIGPDSVGYSIVTKGIAWGGSTVTATDVALADGYAEISGDPRVDVSRTKKLDKEFVKSAVSKIVENVEKSIDMIKTSRESMPVVLVGGGGIIS